MTRNRYQGSSVTDSELLKEYLRGNSRALERLIQRYEQPLFTFIERMVGYRDEAEDIYQETLLQVLRNISSYKERGTFGSWLFSIAHHKCIDLNRRQKRWEVISVDHEDLKDPAPLPDAVLEKKELNEMIFQALQNLQPEQREVFLLRQHSELTFREIAEMIDRPLNTVLSQMRLALLSIRKYLQSKMK